MKLTCFIGCLLLALSGSLQAHDARPLSVTIVEQGAELFRVIVRAPPTLQAPSAPTLVWPEQCDILESSALSGAIGSVSLVSCQSGLAGSLLRLDYPEFNPSLTALFRLERLNGVTMTRILPPDQLSWQVPVAPDLSAIAAQYTMLGIRHILEGLDHLLFVAGLLLLAKKPRKILLAVSGFTVAHSITLGLASVELVRLPVDLVETLIALSVVFLAAEIFRNDENSFSQRFPVLLSFAFGLLHGFGFASALEEIALPPAEVLKGLLFFNVGVELGQLIFIVLCFLLWRPFARWQKHSSDSSEGLLILENTRLIQLGAWLIALPAAYWFAERSLQLLLP